MSNSAGFSSGLSIGSFDADDESPTLDLAPADSAAVSGPGHARLRFNLSTQRLEQSISTGAWTAIATGTTAGDSLARYIVQQPNGSLPNAQSLSVLGTGIVKNTTATGVLSIAIPNTDFPATTAQYIVATSTAAPPNAQNLGVLTSGILKQTVTSGISTISIATPGIDYTGRTPQQDEFWCACIDQDGLVLAGNDTTGAIGIGIPGQQTRSVTVTGSDTVVASTKQWHFTNGAFTTNDVGGKLIKVGGTNAGTYFISSIVNTTDVLTARAGTLTDETFSGTHTLTVVGGPGAVRDASLAAAKLTPFKSLERLGQVLPRFGNGASVWILIKPRTAGATYKRIDLTTDSDFSWADGCNGWKMIFARPTADFSNSTEDKIQCGYQILPGTNASGYNPTVGATVNTIPCQLAGGGAAALAAEDFSGIGVSGVVGYRIRFLATTTTTLLQNVAIMIWKNTSSQIITAKNLPVAPSITDTFVIEQTAFRVFDGSMKLGVNFRASIAGVGSTGTVAQVAVVINSPSLSTSLFSGWEVGPGVHFGPSAGCTFMTIGESYVDETAGYSLSGLTSARQLGVGYRARLDNAYAQFLTVTCSIDISDTTRVWNGTSGRLHLGAGCIMKCGFIWVGSDFAANPLGQTENIDTQTAEIISTTNVFGNDSLTTFQRLRIPFPQTGNSSVNIIGGSIRLRGIDVSNNIFNVGGPSGAVIAIGGIGTNVAIDDIVSTDGGNVGPVIRPYVYGATQAPAYNATVVIGTKIALGSIASGGDIELADQATFIPFSTLTARHVVDTHGNTFIGTAGVKFTGLSVPARTVATSGTLSDLVATASGQFLKRDGNNTLVFGAITTADIQTVLDPFRTPKANEFWVYKVDYDGTADNTIGTPGISTTMATALAAAIPFKTFERLGQVLPRNGNGATLVILAKPRAAGANYRNMANSADQDGTWLNGLAGWHVLIRGSLDFANDTNDKIRSGFLTASGTNTAGYKTTAGTTTTSLLCQLAGGGVPSFPSEGFSGITGLRIRYLANTPTVALQNFCTGIWKNTSGTLVPMQTLPAAPLPSNDASGGDIFVIESPGVGLGVLTFSAGTNRLFSMAGLSVTNSSTIVFKTPLARIAGCTFGAVLTLNDGDSYTVATSYTDEADVAITVGYGCRVATSITVATSKSFSMSASSWLGTATRLTVASSVTQINVGSSCVSFQGITASGTLGPANAAIGAFGAAGFARMRIVGANILGSAAVHLGGAGARVFGVDFSNCVVACVKVVQGNAGVGKYYLDDLVSPDGGNISATPTTLLAAVLNIEGTKLADGVSVFIANNAGGAVTATADRDILFDAGTARFADLGRSPLYIGGIHIYGGNPAAGVSNELLTGPVGRIETGGDTNMNAFYGSGPYPAFRVWRTIGNISTLPNSPCFGVLASAATEATCSGILGPGYQTPEIQGDTLWYAAGGTCKVEFVAGQLSSYLPDGSIAYLSELTGLNTGKARIGIPASGVAVPLGPIHTVDFDTYTYAWIDFTPAGRNYIPSDGHISTSVIGNPLTNRSRVIDIQATASGQFLHRDGNNALVFSPITTADLPAIIQQNTDTAVASLAELALVPVTGFTNKDRPERFVNTLRDTFYLDKTSTLTADGITIITAAGGTGRWIRKNIANISWGLFSYVSIDSINGNDENFGFGTSMATADAVALKTFAELNRRIPDTGFKIDMVCHVLNSIPDDQEDIMLLTRLRVQSYDTKFVIIGALTSTSRPALFTGTVSSYVAAVPSTNTDRHLTLTGAPAGLVGRLIQKSDGTKSAYIMKDLGSSTYRIKRPVTSDSLTGDLGAATDFVNGETVVVYDLPTMPITPFPATAFSRDLVTVDSNLILSNFKLRSPNVGTRVQIEMGGTSHRLVNCILVDPAIFGGINAGWGNVLFTSDTVGLGFLAGARNLQLSSCALLNTQLLIRDCDMEARISIDIQGNSGQVAFATFHLQKPSKLSVISADVGVFDTTQGVFDCLEGCSYLAAGGTLYGTGNSFAAFYSIEVGSGIHCTVRVGSQFAVTSAAHPISINSVGYDFTDLPISLAFSQITIVNA